MLNQEPGAAPDPTLQQPSDAVTASTPSESPAGSPPANGSTTERNRLAEEGRKRAALERQNTALQQQLVEQQAQLQAVQQQLGGITNLLGTQQRTEQEARLAALPPGERLQAELALVRQDLAYTQQALQQQQQQQYQQQQAAARQEQALVYKRQRMAELIDDANETFGLDGDLVIQGTEEELDDSNETAFRASVRTLAQARKRYGLQPASGGEDTVAQKKPETLEQMETRIKRQVLQELGVQQSNSPKAVASGNDSAERVDEDRTQALRNYDNKRPGLLRQQLREQADRASIIAPGGRRGR